MYHHGFAALAYQMIQPLFFPFDIVSAADDNQLALLIPSHGFDLLGYQSKKGGDQVTSQKTDSMAGSLCQRRRTCVPLVVQIRNSPL